METELLELSVQLFGIMATALFMLVLRPDPDDFPYYERLFPEQAARRAGMKMLYETKEGILQKGDEGFKEVLETIDRNSDELDVDQPNRIVHAGTHGTGKIVELQHSEGRETSTDRGKQRNATEVQKWLETETVAPTKRIWKGIGTVAIGFQVLALFI